jgi:hypothetical protein
MTGPGSGLAKWKRSRGGLRRREGVVRDRVEKSLIWSGEREVGSSIGGAVNLF